MGLPDWIGNHVCRATGSKRFLATGGTLEEAASLANHADMRTARIYDKPDPARTMLQMEHDILNRPSKSINAQLGICTTSRDSFVYGARVCERG